MRSTLRYAVQLLTPAKVLPLTLPLTLTLTLTLKPLRGARFALALPLSTPRTGL